MVMAVNRISHPKSSVAAAVGLFGVSHDRECLDGHRGDIGDLMIKKKKRLFDIAQ